MTHPNATAAGSTTTAGALALYVLGLFGVTIPPIAAVAAVGALTTVVLFVGRVGIRGTIKRIMNGSGS